LQTNIFLSSMAVVGRLRKFHFGPSKAGWSLGYVSAVDSQGRTIWIADAHRDDGRRFVVRADEILTAFLELEICDSIRQNATEDCGGREMAKAVLLLRYSKDPSTATIQLGVSSRNSSVQA
jgi:hypothetical protein